MNEEQRKAEIDRLAARLLQNQESARELVEFLINVTAACHVNGCDDETGVPDFIRDQAERIGVLRRQLELLGQVPASCVCPPDGDDPACMYCAIWSQLHLEAMAADVGKNENDQDAKAFRSD